MREMQPCMESPGGKRAPSLPKMQIPLLECPKKEKKKRREKMKVADLNLLAQLTESMARVADELEKAIGKRDAERVKRAKEEILNFQRQVDKIIRK